MMGGSSSFVSPSDIFDDLRELREIGEVVANSSVTPCSSTNAISFGSSSNPSVDRGRYMNLLPPLPPCPTAWSSIFANTHATGYVMTIRVQTSPVVACK